MVFNRSQLFSQTSPPSKTIYFWKVFIEISSKTLTFVGLEICEKIYRALKSVPWSKFWIWDLHQPIVRKFRSSWFSIFLVPKKNLFPDLIFFWNFFIDQKFCLLFISGTFRSIRALSEENEWCKVIYFFVPDPVWEAKTRRWWLMTEISQTLWCQRSLDLLRGPNKVCFM